MIYVGEGFRSGYRWETEPALIDPALTVRSSPYHDELPYWPAYAELTPAQRGRYLTWLVDGAEDPLIAVGYAFLYFYGLERRFFVDGPDDDDERNVLLEEVRRLRNLFKQNGSFNGYASAFIRTAEVLRLKAKLYLGDPTLEPHWEVRLTTKVALGQAAVDGVSIPPIWMLKWLIEDPDTSLRTPATRCARELFDLFRIRFEEDFPNGFLIKPNKIKLFATYRPASRNIGVGKWETGLPDISRLQRPINQVRPILDRCTDELDSYSRFLGRHPEEHGSREAISLLPRPLAQQYLVGKDDAFTDHVSSLVDVQQFAPIDTQALSRLWVDGETKRLTSTGTLRKSDWGGLCAYLDLIGLAVEPDVRHTGKSPRSKNKAIVYKPKHTNLSLLSANYKRAALTLRLLATVAHADDEIADAERESLTKQVHRSTGLGEHEKERLEAHLHYLLVNPPSMRGAQNAIDEHLTTEMREAVAQFALLMAVADGHFDASESKVIKKVYQLLGLDPSSIYSDLHHLQAGADRPTTVRPASPARTSYTIPTPDKAESKDTETITLDMDLVRQKLLETQEVSAILASVFVEKEEVESPEDVVNNEGKFRVDSLFSGLAPLNAALLDKLLAQPDWERSDYETLVTDMNLMPGGALETINEWAFDSLGDLLIEDGDPLLIDLDLWNQHAVEA